MLHGLDFQDADVSVTRCLDKFDELSRMLPEKHWHVNGLVGDFPKFTERVIREHVIYLSLSIEFCIQLVVIPLRVLFGKTTFLAPLAPNASRALLVDLVAHIIVLKGNFNKFIVLLYGIYWFILHKVHRDVELVLPSMELDE